MSFMFALLIFFLFSNLSFYIQCIFVLLYFYFSISFYKAIQISLFHTYFFFNYVWLPLIPGK